MALSVYFLPYICIYNHFMNLLNSGSAIFTLDNLNNLL